MDINRRTFLGGAIATAIAPGRGDATVVTDGANAIGSTAQDDAASGMECEEFPYLLLELCGKYYGEGKDALVTHTEALRIVSVDMEDEEDWGDVNSFYDGEDLALGLGNDMDGYWKIVRVFEMVEPRDDLHEGKFPVAYELTLDEFRDMMEQRIDSWY